MHTTQVSMNGLIVLYDSSSTILATYTIKKSENILLLTTFTHNYLILVL